MDNKTKMEKQTEINRREEVVTEAGVVGCGSKGKLENGVSK